MAILSALKVTEIAELRAEASNFITHADDIKTVTRRMLNLVEQSNSVWKGDAQNKYMNQFLGLSDDMERIHINCTEYGEKLLKIADNYEKSENSNVTTANALKPDVMLDGVGASIGVGAVGAAIAHFWGKESGGADKGAGGFAKYATEAIKEAQKQNSYREVPEPNIHSDYYDKAKNGYKGYGMPNCTAYAYGRLYERTGEKPNLSPNNASTFYQYNEKKGIYDHNSDPYEPRVGAVVCYSGGAGHVQVVEEVGSDAGGKYIVVSESNYGANENPAMAFNKYKIYCKNLENGNRYKGMVEVVHLEDNDGFNNDDTGKWWIGTGDNTPFQGYIYAEKSPEFINMNEGANIAIDGDGRHG